MEHLKRKFIMTIPFSSQKSMHGWFYFLHIKISKSLLKQWRQPSWRQSGAHESFQNAMFLNKQKNNKKNAEI